MGNCFNNGSQKVSLKDHLFQRKYYCFRSVYMWQIRSYCSLLAALAKLYFIRNETIQTLGTIDVQSLIFGNSLKKENENRLVHVFEIV